MTIQQSIKEILHTTQKEQQNKNQATIQKGKELSLSQLQDSLNRCFYKIGYYQNSLKNPELPETSKAKIRTALFQLEELKKRLQKQISDICFEEYF